MSQERRSTDRASALRPRTAVERMEAYRPPTAGRAGKLRLDFNENTTGFSPRVRAAIAAALEADLLSMYPESGAAQQAVAAHLGASVDSLLLTNGTDEAIQLLMNVFVEGGDEVVLLRPSYAMYRFYAELAGGSIRWVDYDAETLAHPETRLLAAIGARTRLAILANPNNPTGTGVQPESIERLLAHLERQAPEAALLVDEAYFEFSGVTALPLLPHRQLFVCRTFSKAYGLAGLRAGCLVADPANAALLRKAQSPYSFNVLAAVAVGAALADREFVAATVRQVHAAREALYRGFERRGVRFHPSAGNFVLFDGGERSAALCAALSERGILVRDRGHDLPGAVRVTAGTPEQVERFFAAFDDCPQDAR